MQHDHILKKMYFDLLTPPQGSKVGVLGQNFCSHVAAFIIPFNLICNMTIFWNKWILTFWPQPQGRGVGGLVVVVGGGGGGGEVCGQIFDTMLLHLWFRLTWYATRPCSEKVECWLFDPPGPVGGGGGGLRAKYLLSCCCIRDFILFDIKHDHVLKKLLKKLNFGLCPTPQSTKGLGPRPSN